MTPEIARSVLEREVDRIKSLPPSDFTRANQDLNLETAIPVLGEIDVFGFIFFGIDCALVLPDGANLVFEASGFSFVIGEFSSMIMGSLVVDPTRGMDGPCHYSIACGAEGEGMLTFSLYRTNGQLIGTFAGMCEGIGLCVVSGSGTLQYRPLAS